jgi:SEC-C motif
MVLRANAKESRQLTLTGPMLLWRDKAGGGREGLLLATDVCEDLRCATRHLGIHALWVGDGLVSASLGRTMITTKSEPGSNGGTRPAFFVSLSLDDGTVKPQEGDRPDPMALAWFKAELDNELRAVLLARFEGDRRRLRAKASTEVAARVAPPTPASVPVSLRAPVGRPGRNDPCPCGSGRKYKRCCLDRAA